MIFEFIYNIFIESIHLWLEIAPYLLLGMFIAGILHVFLGQDFIVQHLGGKPFGSIMKATLFGIPLPICSCGVIPVAASLRKEGASKSATLSFLVSTPTTGVDSILATYSLMGPLFALFRPLAAFLSGITIGSVSHIVEKERKTENKAHKHIDTSHSFKMMEVFRYGFGELVEDVGKWLVLGVLIGGILTVAIPQNLITENLSSVTLQFIVMLAISIPLYVCATGSIPIAASLILKGFSPGAALVFLIAGPATNTVTLSFVLSKLGKKSFIVYLSSIATISLIAGAGFHFLWQTLGGDIGLISGHGTHIPLWLQVGAGSVLFILVFIALVPSRRKAADMRYNISVPDISCKHCKMTLENKIGELKGVREVVVDVDQKIVHVDGDIAMNDITHSIQEAGYTPMEK